MARSILDICNEALGELPAETISDLNDETKQSARHCKRLYRGVISDLLEAYDWGFGKVRVAMAVIGNTRPGEWAFAYALPAGIGTPMRILPAGTASPAANLIGFAGTVGVANQLAAMVEYQIAGQVLYTNLPDAILEYLPDEVQVSSFTSSFARLVVLELASRLVMPILNDATRQRSLMQMAEIQRQRAIADEANRTPDYDDDFVSERARARGVGMGTLGTFDTHGYGR
ncbi:hypothetical protein K3M67_04790 [Sphingobium sp. V4]|uniref:hypothetical protein n=1 Tax=Sphingobium sp. V4 TaxID=3038927 RepID=UPI0025582387|nr:hypothetical protein [Sphingobium sp. V4]WIW89296.1 hypothetical protein K3M67_04790 [Sphingobium sp. V4]